MRESDVEGILPDPRPELRDWYKGTITLAWQVTPRSKLRSVTNFDEYCRRNTEGLGVRPTTPRAAPTRRSTSPASSGRPC